MRIFLSVQCLASSLARSVILSLASANAFAHAISSLFVPFPPRISSLEGEEKVLRPFLNFATRPQVRHQVGNFLCSCDDLVVRVVPLFHLWRRFPLNKMII